MPTPLFKDWFDKLKVDERVKCLTTIDKQITSQILHMCQNLLTKWKQKPERTRKKFPWFCDGMFVLTTRQKTEMFTWHDRHTDEEDPMVVLHEMKLMDNIIFTDTIEDHDTISINPKLVEDA